MKDEKKIWDSENKLQADCFQWFHNTYPHLRKLLYHVPNELVGMVNPVAANRMVSMGVVSGALDLQLHFRSRTYFFELKRPDGKGRLSDDQKEMIKQLDTQRFIVHVVDSLEDFKYLVSSILQDTSQQFTHGITKEDYYYKHKIFDYIYSLTNDQVIKIEDITEEDTRSKFISFVSEFMVEGYDKLDGFELLFTPDYKGFYRKKWEL